MEGPSGAELPKPPSERIATYEQLKNPNNQDISPQKMADILEEGKVGGFKRFTPDNVGGSVIGTMMGDSPYGVRVGVAKAIIAQALYSPDEFERFARETSASEGQEAAESEGKFGATRYKVEKAIRTTFHKKQFIGDYLTGEWEINQVRQHKTNSAAYQTLGEIVHQIGEKYQDQGLTPEDILRLSEIDHYFSGKWNGTGANITFTDPDIRKFGTDLQQVVERVWRAGLEDVTATPLSEEELFPERYPGR